MILRSLATALLIVPLAVAFAACGDDDDGSSGDDAADATTPAATAAPTGAGPTTLDISAQDFAFSPATLSAVAGEEVTLTITNDGNATHTFTIDDLDVDVQLAPGDEQTVTFTPTGDDTFYCRFHRAAGMEGTLSTDASSADPGAVDPSPTTAIGNYRY